MDPTENSWELSKENVQPLRQGRKIANLTAALQPVNGHDGGLTRVQHEKQAFEAELRMYSGDDPFSVWDRYIKWTEQNYPKGGKDGSLSTLLERCLLFFKDDKRYSNDHRYLQAWIKFAGMTNQPVDIYSFLHDQAIGAQVALFWEAWAWELEQEGDTKKADAVYMEGIQKQAQPVDLLVRKQKEFQARVTRATLEGGGVAQPADMSSTEAQRVTLGGLRGHGKKHQAPVNRTGAATKVYSSGLGVKPCAPPQVGQAFSVFSEDNPQDQVIPTPTGEWTNPPLPRVTSRENTHKPGKWTEAKVSQKAVPAIPFKAVSMNASSEFSIHVEEGAAQPQPTPQKPIEMGTQVLSARKPEKSLNPLRNMYMPPFEDEPNKIPKYCKKFVYTGLEEFQFEELRAARHVEMEKKRKMEEEMRRQEEQRREMEAQHQLLLAQQRQQLQQMQQTFQQEQLALQQERKQMMEQCRQQMLRERAEMERLLVERMRDTTLESAQLPGAAPDAEPQDIMQDSHAAPDSHIMPDSHTVQNSHVMQDSHAAQNSHTLQGSHVVQDSHIMLDSRHIMQDSHAAQENDPATAAGLTEREHTVTKHLNFEESLASGLQPSVVSAMAEFEDYNTDVKMVEPTPVKTAPLADTGDLRSGQFLLSSATPASTGKMVTSREQSLVKTPNTSTCSGPTPSTTPGRRPITDPSPTINTKAAMMELGEFFRDDIGFGAVGGSDGFEDMFAAGPSGGTASSGLSFSAPQVQTNDFKGFTIFDESKDTVLEDRMDMKDQVVLEDQENNPPGGYQTGAKRRGLGVLQPSQGIPVEETKEVDDLDGIEPFADDSPDMTFASTGNQSSFCTMARMASTPFNRTGPELPELPASSIRPVHNSTRKALGMLEISTTEDLAEAGGSGAGRVSAESTEETFDMTVGNRAAAALSPIMENSSEEKSQVSTDHGSTDSAPSLSVAMQSTSCTDPTAESEAVATSNSPPPAEDEVFVTDVNPFDPEVVSSLLAKVRGSLTSHQEYQEEDGHMPQIKPGVAINLGTELYHIDKLVGSGAFAKIYQASMLDADDLTDLEGERKVTLKVQQPGCPWEFYINSQVHERVSRLQDPMDIKPSLMSIDAMHVFSDGSVLVNEQHSCGSLLDIINLYRTARKKMSEVMVVFYTLEILYIVEQLHRCHIIHADLKPDNFLIRDGFEDKTECLFSGELRGLKLIDFGISLDMELFPPNTTFRARSNTSAFQCIEMQTGKPWSYQADLYAIVSTVHCMLFGEYMKAYYEGGRWKITQTPRRTHDPVWRRFFDTFLNIPSCDELPSLSYWISEFHQCWEEKKKTFDKEKWAQYTMYFEKH
ncbi:BUB1B [Branchiostoma lanceolatum]|uniref:BUB1B protein n=1 Tax=Branchiostoma lanceolatum TaxID=7740 RepID=A0A8J9ZS11_BRALA|nr:BUB1B [Branchiostoma lanceolatum]